jgi:hypothetical protein
MVAMGAAASLGACDNRAGGNSSESAAAATAPPASATGTITGVKPVPEDHAASSTGPSDGSAAIGGLAGGEGTGAHPSPPKGNVPAATAGDGAAAAASK